MVRLLAIALGGAAGSLLRMTVCTLTERHLGSGFPLGTLLVNIFGGFLIGLIAGASAQVQISPIVRDALVIGGLGALTTFSAFSLDTVSLASTGGALSALGNVAANVLLALAATVGGLALGRSL